MAFELDLSKDTWPPLPTVAERAVGFISQVDYITQQTILGGFDYTVGDTRYHFSYDNSDQTNFAQANTSAALSLQLDSTPPEVLKAQFGTAEDGSPLLPIPLPANWIIKWNGHVGGRVVELALNVKEYLALAAAAGMHNTESLALGRILKDKLRNAVSDEELDKIVKDNDIINRYRTAQDNAVK